MEQDILSRIIAQVKRYRTDTTSQNPAKYSCSECRDTGWVETGHNSLKRCRCVDLKISRENWSNYGVRLDEVKTLEAYVTISKIGAAARQKAANYIAGFNEMRQKENNWFGIFGQPGDGKSHVIIAIGAALLDRPSKPVRVLYMPYLEVIRELKAKTMDHEKYSKFTTYTP
jgi:DNA replication protein DnaC